MSQQLSHIEMILSGLLHAISEALRVERKAKPGSHASREAQHVRQTLEPMAAKLIDEEICDRSSVMRMITTSGSLALVKHLKSVCSFTTILDRDEWRRLYQVATPQTISAMLDENLSPRLALVPLLDCVADGDTALADLILSRIATGSSLTAIDLDHLIQGLILTQERDTRYQTSLKALELQVAHFPKEMLDLVEDDLICGNETRAVVMIAAGLDPKRINKHDEIYFDIKQPFYQMISSNHGILELHRRIGSLDALFLGRGLASWGRLLPSQRAALAATSS